MRRVVLSCFAGIFVGLVMILLPLVIFQPNPLMTSSMLGQRGTVPFTDNATGNAASPTKESGAGLGTPDAEALLSDHQFSVGNPIESFGLTSISILFAFSVFIASRHAIRHGKTPRE